MATTPVNPIGYPTNMDFNTSNPRTIAAQNLTGIVNTGNQLYNQQAQRYNQGTGQAQATQDYLGGIMNPLAQGQGGYNAQETSQIEMTPQQQQNMITSAGISAGTNTQAASDAAQRAANAAGGNPAAVAAYRARAANQAGAQAGNAMTNARVQTQAQEAANAENVGQARLGQQNNALNYYGNLQSQQNQNAQNAANQQQQTYQTQSSGSNGAAQTGLAASQTPSTFDKIIGGVGGALSFLDEGGVSGDGDDGAGIAQPGFIPNPATAPTGTPTSPTTMPFWQRFQHRMQAQQQPQSQGQQTQGGSPRTVNPGNVGGSIGSSAGKIASLFMADGGFPKESIRDEGLIPSYGAAKPDYLSDGGMGGTAVVGEGGPEAVGDMTKGYMDKGSVFDKPTAVRLDKGDAVVPLGYRANAKVRPSAAMPMINNMQAANKLPRKPYQGMGNPSQVMA